MINVVIVISSLPLVLKINIGTSGDCTNCVIGWQIVVVLWRFLWLYRRRCRWIWLGFSLSMNPEHETVPMLGFRY
jgi:hypothetical protein